LSYFNKFKSLVFKYGTEVV